jgi:hypothetical protein
MNVVSRLAPIRRLEPSFDRKGKQQIDQTLVAPMLRPSEAIFSAFHAFDLKLLAWENAVLLAYRGRHNDLALARNNCFHRM